MTPMLTIISTFATLSTPLSRLPCLVSLASSPLPRLPCLVSLASSPLFRLPCLDSLGSPSQHAPYRLVCQRPSGKNWSSGRSATRSPPILTSRKVTTCTSDEGFARYTSPYSPHSLRSSHPLHSPLRSLRPPHSSLLSPHSLCSPHPLLSQVLAVTQEV